LSLWCLKELDLWVRNDNKKNCIKYIIFVIMVFKGVGFMGKK